MWIFADKNKKFVQIRVIHASVPISLTPILELLAETSMIPAHLNH